MKKEKSFFIAFAIVGVIIAVLLAPFQQEWAYFIFFIALSWGAIGWCAMDAYEKWHEIDNEEKLNQ